ncbi:MAG: hypothetical protein JSV88_07345 [Candidatus Aminicenantes bacterium]|nr:MAG: hypothetical protein JSV88_07345 [Candidatus Aminicenantes bacterium]
MMKDTIKSKIKKILFIIVPLFIIILAGYTFYISNLEKYMDEQDTLIFGQNKFSPGSMASFRDGKRDQRYCKRKRINFF